MDIEQAIAKFSVINLDPKVITSFAANKKVTTRLSAMIEMAGGKAEKTQGNLLYTLSTKLPPTQEEYMKSFVEQIMSNNWTKVMQIEEAVAFMKDKLTKEGTSFVIEKKEFETASGVGVTVTDQDCHNLVET